MKRMRRTFTKEFKNEITNQIETNKIPIADLSRQHQISENLILRWINDARAARVAETPGQFKERRKDYATTQELKAKIAELYMKIEQMQRSGLTWKYPRQPNKEV